MNRFLPLVAVGAAAAIGRRAGRRVEGLLPTNDYGNIDIRSGVPKGLAYVEGKRLTVTCRSLKIECAPAMTGWLSSRRGSWKPDLTGVVVHKKNEAALRTAIEHRAQRRKTPAQTAAAKQRRQTKAVAAFKARILDCFPGMPEAEAGSVAARATEIGSGRVGRSRTAEDPVLAAVVAHVRHRHTDYEMDLGTGVERHEARRMAGEQIAAILDQWRGRGRRAYTARRKLIARFPRKGRRAWEDEGMVQGRWGSHAAGVLFQAESTGRYLLLLRSQEVLDPGLWGIPGGAVPVNPVTGPKDALDSALDEAREEAGWSAAAPRVVRRFVWEAPDSDFTYSTFLLMVPDEFRPRLNWESDEGGWFTREEALDLDNLHLGVRWVLE